MNQQKVSPLGIAVRVGGALLVLLCWMVFGGFSFYFTVKHLSTRPVAESK